jgi:site-specific DNA recombinase
MNIIYCRYSPRPEHAAERAVSLQVQIEACQKYCDINNLAVDRITEDPEVSARTTPLFDRPSGSRLMTLPENSNVIAMKLDRVFRKTIDGLQTLEYWKVNHVRLHLANEGGCSIDTSTATGEMIATFLLGVASWEPRAIAERTKSAMNHRMDNNKAHLNPANFPYGMMEDPDSRKHAKSRHHEGMIPCPEEQAIINEILCLRKDKWSYASIANVLNDDGITCRGSKWFPQSIKRIVKRYEE